MIFKNKKNVYYIPIKKKSSKILIPIFFLLIFAFLFIYFGYLTVNYYKQISDEKKVIQKVSIIAIKDKMIESEKKTEENATTSNIDFDSMKKINDDLVSYIKVNGTDIEYPVLKGIDNVYYLKHNFYKEYNIAGWIFMDYENQNNNLDQNTIIYGHNMKNGTMFGSLKNVLTKEWYDNKDNHYISYITNDETMLYEIFSIYEVENEDYYRQINFIGSEFSRFLETIKQRSIYNFDVPLTNDDKILTLSTCASNNKYRLVVHAKKLNDLNKGEKYEKK